MVAFSYGKLDLSRSAQQNLIDLPVESISRFLPDAVLFDAFRIVCPPTSSPSLVLFP